MSETILPPCPGCGGKLEQQSAYDRSAGQYTCAGECGWSWPVDRYARLARAVAVAAAVDRIGAFRVYCRRDGTYTALTSRPDRTLAASGAVPADALIELARKIDV